MAELGWTVDQVAECPMPDVWKITRHWKRKRGDEEPTEPRQAMKMWSGARQPSGNVPEAVKEIFRKQVKKHARR